MRRRYLGFALISLGAAAAVAMLPQSGDGVGNLSFLPTELRSLPYTVPLPPSGSPGMPPQNPPPIHQQSDPLDVIDLSFDGAKVYVADLSDDPLSDDPASEPVGGEGQTAKGGGKSNDTGSPKGTTTSDDPFGSIIPGNGYFAANGGGGLITLSSNEHPTDHGPAGDSSASDGGGGGGGGGGGEGENPNKGDPTSNNRPNDLVDTVDTTTPISVDEPAPLSLLLVGGLALVLARRAKHRAAR
jgi:hypothetical protein